MGSGASISQRCQCNRILICWLAPPVAEMRRTDWCSTERRRRRQVKVGEPLDPSHGYGKQISLPTGQLEIYIKSKIADELVGLAAGDGGARFARRHRRQADGHQGRPGSGSPAAALTGPTSGRRLGPGTGITFGVQYARVPYDMAGRAKESTWHWRPLVVGRRCSRASERARRRRLRPADARPSGAPPASGAWAGAGVCVDLLHRGHAKHEPGRQIVRPAPNWPARIKVKPSRRDHSFHLGRHNKIDRQSSARQL